MTASFNNDPWTIDVWAVEMVDIGVGGRVVHIMPSEKKARRTVKGNMALKPKLLHGNVTLTETR